MAKRTTIKELHELAASLLAAVNTMDQSARGLREDVKRLDVLITATDGRLQQVCDVSTRIYRTQVTAMQLADALEFRLSATHRLAVQIGKERDKQRKAKRK